MSNNLKIEVSALIAEVDKTHRYSMTRIYELANKVFNQNEAPQSCASCLIRKVRLLRRWLEEQEATDIESAIENKKRQRKSIKRKNS